MSLLSPINNTNTFQCRFLFFDIGEDSHYELTVYVHEFMPMTWKRCTHVEWAENSIREHSAKDLREMLGILPEGNIQVLATGKLTGYRSHTSDGEEWDENLEFRDVKSEPLSKEFVEGCMAANPYIPPEVEPTNKLKKPITDLISQLQCLPKGTTYELQEVEQRFYGGQCKDAEGNYVGTGYEIRVDVVEGIVEDTPTQGTPNA